MIVIKRSWLRVEPNTNRQTNQQKLTIKSLKPTNIKAILHYKPFKTKSNKKMQGTKLKNEINKYYNEDFKNLYRQVKCMSLLNQLYDSDTISNEQFEIEEKQIMSKITRLKMHLNQHDLEAFAKLYDIQKDMKRIGGHLNNRSSIGSERELLSLGLTLGSKFPELQDTIHASKETREVKDVINILSEMTILLNKYKKLAKKISPDLVQQIEKLNKIYFECKKKNINQQFTAMEYYELEDAISKLWLEFSNSL